MPVPNDPGSGKAFEYALTEGGFTLVTPDVKTSGHLKLMYEVAMRVKK